MFTFSAAKKIYVYNIKYRKNLAKIRFIYHLFYFKVWEIRSVLRLNYY